MDAQHQYPHQVAIKLSPPPNQAKSYLSIIANALKVDKELKAQTLAKDISYAEESDTIEIKFQSKELKLLRACVTGFLRHMQLVSKTIAEFHP